MTQSQDVSNPRRRWLRRLSLILIVGLVCVLALVAALPWIVETPIVQRRLAAAASRVLAPAEVRFDHLRVFWSRPIEIANLVLRDAQGDDIVSSPTAHLSWNLRETLLSRPDPVTLTLDHAIVDIERLADGTFDLLETLRPILKDEPDRTILVRVVDGTLRFRAAGLNEPFYADKANIDLDLNAYPQPNAWRLKLERAVANAAPGTVQITGSVGRKKGENGRPEDLELKVVGERWPWVFTRDDLQARGGFTGTIAALRKSGKVTVEGDAKLVDLAATGKALSGDEVRLETVTLGLNLNRSKGVWTADRLDVASSLGKLSAKGSYPPAGERGGRIEGKLDLAALAAQIPRALRLGKDIRVEKGALELHAEITGAAGQSARSLNIKVGLSDLQARQGARTLSLRDPATLAVRARIAHEFERLELSELAVVTPYGRLEGSGQVKDLTGSPSFDLSGVVTPDWKALTETLAREVEPKASISGAPRSWRVSGTLPKSGKEDWLAELSGELGVNLEQVDVYGMRLGRAAVVVHADKGKIKIDPIDSTLNSGRLHLEPELIQDKQGVSWVHLGPSSSLMDVVVNDEVSHRVLMYAAPVLDQATRVRGRVSLVVSDAYFPLAAGKDVQPKVDGDVLFDSVEFMPGPLAEAIITIFRQERRPLLVLRDPVSIRIVGRTIYQEGLIIPLGNVAAVGIEGTVDFDQNLNLVASFAVAPPQKKIPVLSEILEHARIQVPITGTFKNPKINRDALAERFKDLGVNMLDSVLGTGINGLGRIFQGRSGAGNGGPPRDFFPPLDPPVRDRTPPPPQPGVGNSAKDQGSRDKSSRPARTERPRDDADDDLEQPTGWPGQHTPQQRQLLREERKARKLEKRTERRMRRGLPPD
ncbi:MAG: hypothetical protein ACP5XB_21545 [Isosphaeraceae bacterium]